VSTISGMKDEGSIRTGVPLCFHATSPIWEVLNGAVPKRGMGSAFHKIWICSSGFLESLKALTSATDDCATPPAPLEACFSLLFALFRRITKAYQVPDQNEGGLT